MKSFVSLNFDFHVYVYFYFIKSEFTFFMFCRLLYFQTGIDYLICYYSWFCVYLNL